MLNSIKSIRQAKKLVGKRVFLRTDFNVPVEKGKVADDYKIMASLPTIRFLLRYRAKIIIASHLGRPDGRREKKYSLAPVARHLGGLLDEKVRFSDDCTGLAAGTAVGKMKPGEILMLENLRFAKGEEKNDKKFAKELAGLADIYVNDAFANSHRKHASMAAIKKYLPSYAGLLLAEEVENLNKIIYPRQPLIAVIGGAKIGTKISFIRKLSQKSFKVLIGGALANNFFAARGMEIGKSLADKKSVALAKSLKAKNILLPVDVVVSGKKDGRGPVKVKNDFRVNKNEAILDIGPKTVRLYSSFLKKAQTIIWNGPMGMFENEHFKHGTLAIARVIASRSRGRAFGVVGGGETIAALKMTGMEDYVDWISTGGGATLAFLNGEKMPGLSKITK
ncbi:MAG: phosphoglycerate kinase [Patescibacteria group bacterium]|nr:phosphoglycerate kinase [Patescibacteria group bacterium]